MDRIVFKVTEGSKVNNKTIYITVGLKGNERKEVLGLFLGKNESSSFWKHVLNDIKAQGTENMQEI
jgi:transposase-like protein